MRTSARRDFAIAGAIAVVEVVGAAFAGTHQDTRLDFGVGGALLLVAGAVALGWRVRHPVAVLFVAYATTLAYAVLGYPEGPVYFSLIVAFCTALLAGHRVVAWATIASGWVTFLWLPPLLGTGDAPSWAAALGLGAWLLVLATTTEIVRIGRERAVERRRAREEEERLRTRDEQLRIARELHDVVAHNLSLINVQAGTALHLIRRATGAGRAPRSARSRRPARTRSTSCAPSSTCSAPGRRARPAGPRPPWPTSTSSSRAAAPPASRSSSEVARDAGGRSPPGRDRGVPGGTGGADERRAPRRRVAHGRRPRLRARRARRAGRRRRPAGAPHGATPTGKGIVGHARAGRTRSAASSRSAPWPTAASACAPASPSRRRREHARDQGRARRRPGAGARRVPGPPRRPGRHRGRRRSGRRRRGGRGDPPATRPDVVLMDIRMPGARRARGHPVASATTRRSTRCGS